MFESPNNKKNNTTEFVSISNLEKKIQVENG